MFVKIGQQQTSFSRLCGRNNDMAEVWNEWLWLCVVSPKGGGPSFPLDAFSIYLAAGTREKIRRMMMIRPRKMKRMRKKKEMKKRGMIMIMMMMMMIIKRQTKMKSRTKK